MNNTDYFVTGPSLDGMYGIAAIDHRTGHKAVAVHFLAHRAEAELLAEFLRKEQRIISEFCQSFLKGSLADAQYWVIKADLLITNSHPTMCKSIIRS